MAHPPMKSRDPSKCGLHLIEGICKPHGIITMVVEIISTLNMPPFPHIEACAIEGCGKWCCFDFW